MLITLIPFVLVFAVMYFLAIRPQQKRAAEHQKTVDAMKKGDRVVTNSGIIGVISRVKDAEFILEIAENVLVSVVKNAISGHYRGESESSVSPQADNAKKEKRKRK
jgi:preprotein translocase subunit YajC